MCEWSYVVRVESQIFALGEKIVFFFSFLSEIFHGSFKFSTKGTQLGKVILDGQRLRFLYTSFL